MHYLFPAPLRCSHLEPALTILARAMRRLRKDGELVRKHALWESGKEGVQS